MPSHIHALRQCDARAPALLTRNLPGHVVQTSGCDGSLSAICEDYRSRPAVLHGSLDPCPEIRGPFPPAVSPRGPLRASLLFDFRALAFHGPGRRPPECDAHTRNILQEKDLRSSRSCDSRIPIPASPPRLRKDGGSNTAGYAHRILWRVCRCQLPCRDHLAQRTCACLTG